MSTDVLIVTDGRRHCVDATIRSAVANLTGDIERWWVYCDSEDRAFRQWLAEFVAEDGPIDTVFWHPDGRQGFAGAIRYAWQTVLADSPATHLFHLEDDFTFNRPVNVDDMAKVLDTHPHLAQLALRRQPWNDIERAAGGVVEVNPDAYQEVLMANSDRMYSWLEHREFWTTNPSLIRTEFIGDHPWPLGPRSEGVYSLSLAADPDLRFGYWGSRESGEWVHHIGNDRVGTGY